MIEPKFYMHDSDRLALDALKAIPGFTQVFKAFMKVWSEKQFYIQNMSTNLRISENQLSKYYNMLPPICEKLGIEVPELYLQLDVNPNAYTAGDTKPFIVMTSGLLETVPEELIPTVLAHECGHIACHHCLYTTMGRFILSEAINYLGLNDLAILPIQVAFFYWMRCSELSADRAATICDGTSDKVVEMCMRFAGYDKDIKEEANIEAFLNQAIEYNQMVNNNALNKTMEFMMFSNCDHPLNAVRAYECNNWGNTETFKKINSYLSNEQTSDMLSFMGEVPMDQSHKEYLGKNYNDIKNMFEELGFTNVSTRKITEKSIFTKEGQVTNIIINNKEGFNKLEWIPTNSNVVIEYYEQETEEEILAAHPGQLRISNSSRKFIGKLYTEVIEELNKVGFNNIETEEIIKVKKGWMDKDKSINKISINGQTSFEKGEWFEKNAIIKITYNSYES